MTDIITWLRAQLDGDEATARRLADSDDNSTGGIEIDMETNYPCFSYLSIGKAFALADIAAKRAILDNAAGDGDIRDLEYGEVKGLLIAVRYLAYAYRHRPGYLPEWAPEGIE